MAIVLLASARTLLGVPRTEFTQLSLQPLDDRGVEVAVTSRESNTSAYSLVLSAGGSVVVREQFELESGESWRETFDIDIPADGLVTASLYLLPNRSVPYRRATLSDRFTAPPPEPANSQPAGELRFAISRS